MRNNLHNPPFGGVLRSNYRRVLVVRYAGLSGEHRHVAAQGLSNGVPVVTLPAKYVRGRFALAMYQQMGYTELVADDVQVGVGALDHRPAS